MSQTGIVNWAPIGAQIQLRCKAHPELRWETRNLVPLVPHRIYYRGHVVKGYDVDECGCGCGLLEAVVPDSWSVVSLQAIAEHRALLASPPSVPPVARLPLGRFLVQQWAWQVGYTVEHAWALAIGRAEHILPPMPAVPGIDWPEEALAAMRAHLDLLADRENYVPDWTHFLYQAWAMVLGYDRQTATLIAAGRVLRQLPPTPPIPDDIAALAAPYAEPGRP